MLDPQTGTRASLDALLPLLTQLSGSMELLAALATHLDPPQAPHPDIAPLLAAVAEGAGVSPDLSVDERRVAAAMIRTFFRQAADLMERPERAPGWVTDDAVTLDSQGRASVILAGILAGLPEGFPLADALRREGARFLDVGTGVGWLAAALCRRFPQLSVVGLDREPKVLELARQNVTRAGLDDRIQLELGDVTAEGARGGFDVVWLPGPFLPPDVLQIAARRAFDALVPGGHVVLGGYGGNDELGSRLADLRAVRSGGSAWDAPRLMALEVPGPASSGFERVLAAAGFVDVAEITRRWPAPFRLVTGRTPSATGAAR